MEKQAPKFIKIVAQVLSYLFHPLFIPTYFFLYLLQVVPFEFTSITPWQLQLKLFSVFWLTAFFPAFAVFLLWKLKFTESIFLKTKKDRIIPYVIVMFFYWWMYYLSRNFTDQPLALKYFYFGIFIASALGLTANHFIKVSLHAIGVSGLLTAVVLASFYYPINNVGWVLIGVLISGAVISARMMVSDHTQKELWLGFIIGLCTQLAAFFWVQ